MSTPHTELAALLARIDQQLAEADRLLSRELPDSERDNVEYVRRMMARAKERTEFRLRISSPSAQ